MATPQTHATTTLRDTEASHSRVDVLQDACDRLEMLALNQGVADAVRYHRVIAAIHEICDALQEAEVAGAPPRLLLDVTARARRIHAQSPFIRRLQEWPRGYPGDFETIEWLCRADNRAEPGSLGDILETYALTSAIAQQHRNKVLAQGRAIRAAMLGRRPGRVLSLGCGSCPDVRSVIDHDVPEDAVFVLCDSDPEALAFSRAALQAAADRCHFVRGFVPRVLRRVGAFAPFDLILAGGLFDYLPDRVITRTLADCWHDLLAPGGSIVFTNIARPNPYRVWMEYIASWRLIERSEDDLRSLCASASISAQPLLRRDATRLSMVAELRKEQGDVPL